MGGDGSDVRDGIDGILIGLPFFNHLINKFDAEKNRRLGDGLGFEQAESQLIGIGPILTRIGKDLIGHAINDWPARLHRLTDCVLNAAGSSLGLFGIGSADEEFDVRLRLRFERDLPILKGVRCDGVRHIHLGS